MRGGGGGGVRDPQMLIKVKKNLHGLVLHQNAPFKPLGEKHIGKKFFLDHPKPPYLFPSFNFFLMNIHVQHFLASDQI